MFAIVFASLAIIGAVIHLGFAKGTRRPGRISEILLLYWLTVAIGATGVFEFAGHAFRADQVAASIGWPAGSPFQQEVGIADLALGVLGISCAFAPGGFWIATVVAAAVMDWGDALGHVQQIVRYGDHHPGNSGAIVWADFLIPAVAIVLLILRARSKPFEDVSWPSVTVTR